MKASCVPWNRGPRAGAKALRNVLDGIAWAVELGAAQPLPKFAPSNDERAGGELFPAGGKGMDFHPMLRDFATGANPDPVMPQDMIEKTHQPGSTTRTADETVMQAHRHHLRLVRTLRIEHIERVAHIA